MNLLIDLCFEINLHIILSKIRGETCDSMEFLLVKNISNLIKLNTGKSFLP